MGTITIALIFEALDKTGLVVIRASLRVRQRYVERYSLLNQKMAIHDIVFILMTILGWSFSTFTVLKERRLYITKDWILAVNQRITKPRSRSQFVQ
jgi:hypothetical protein